VVVIDRSEQSEQPDTEQPDADSASFAPDASSFEAFFTRHHPVLVRALTLALGDVELGRDAASEGFVRALQRWNRVSRYDNAAGWVYRVGLNWARSRRRKTVREVAAHPTEHTFASPEPDFELATALRSLSVDHRAVVVGRYYLDWSEAKVAAALDIAPGTVKSRLSRALERLNGKLAGPTDDLSERTS
jgi:RNA polymerase sigma-70 factor (ECF subfamily)